MKRIMEEAQSKGSTELPPWLVENRDFRKFLKEAEKVCVLLLFTSSLSGNCLCNKYDHKVIIYFFSFPCRLQCNRKALQAAFLSRRHPLSLPTEDQNKRRSRNLSKYMFAVQRMLNQMNPLYMRYNDDTEK